MMKKLVMSLILAAALANPVWAAESKSNKGDLSAENTWVTLDNVSGYAGVGADIRGTFTATLQVECTVDGTEWIKVRVTPPDSTTAVTTMTSAGAWANGAIAGCWKVRVGIPTGGYTSGTASVVIRATAEGGSAGGAAGGGGGGDFDIATFQTTFGTNALFLGTGADNVANTQDHLAMFPYIFDGSTWDRWTGGVNLQVAGSAVATGAGVTGSTVPRVDIASDGVVANSLNTMEGYTQTAAEKLTTIESRMISSADYNQVAKTQGDQVMCYGSSTTPTSVTTGNAQRPWCDLAGRPQVNVSQIGGVAPNMGDGTVNTGTQRVTIANDDQVSDAATLLITQMVADDAASAGNPVYIGGLATASIVGQTPVAGADRIGFVGGLDRVQITRPYANLEDRVSGRVANTDGAATSLVAAQGAGVRFCATNFIVSNASATNVTVDITDGSGGTVLTTLPAAANMGGSVVNLGVPICTTANTALFMDGSAAATTVTVTAVGFKTEL